LKDSVRRRVYQFVTMSFQQAPRAPGHGTPLSPEWKEPRTGAGTEPRPTATDVTPTVAVKSWMGQNTLAGFVWNEVKQANLERRDDVCHAEPVMNKRGEILLGILTYAYATGLFRSREIEEQLMRCIVAKRLLVKDGITNMALRQFRRSNREIIKTCLRNVVCRARQADEKTPAVIKVGRKVDLLRAPSASPDVDIPEAESEARLRDAAIYDSLESYL
jgi:hypothetical protein